MLLFGCLRFFFGVGFQWLSAVAGVVLHRYIIELDDRFRQGKRVGLVVFLQTEYLCMRYSLVATDVIYVDDFFGVRIRLTYSISPQVEPAMSLKAEFFPTFVAYLGYQFFAGVALWSVPFDALFAKGRSAFDWLPLLSLVWRRLPLCSDRLLPFGG